MAQDRRRRRATPRDPVQALFDRFAQAAGRHVADMFLGAEEARATVADSVLTPDPYAALGLPPGLADRRRVDACYRALAALAHPDKKETGDEEWFKRLGQAKACIYTERGWK